MHDPTTLLNLASYRHLLERGAGHWPAFLDRRKEYLAQWDRNGRVAEKVAEDIIKDLLVNVLDWTLADVNNQVDYADIVLTQFSIKRLVLEAKRPGSLAGNPHRREEALNQAWGYAAEQKVGCVAVSDGVVLYAADIENGGPKPRLWASLDNATFPDELWWISRDGVYRPRPGPVTISPPALPEAPLLSDCFVLGSDSLLHGKYRLPAACFAYVGRPDHPASWKLPYRKADGTVDEARMPKAIQCILTTYRGARVQGIPEKAIPDVLVRLGKAAHEARKMPSQLPTTAAAYQELARALDQLGRLAEVESQNTST